MDLELVLKIAGVAVGAAVSLYQLRNRQPKFIGRSRLKADLEILKMLESSDPDGPNYRTVKQSIDATIAKVYEGSIQQGGFKRPKEYDWSLLITGIIFLPGFSFWTWYLVRDGFTWWAPLTGFFAFSGFGMLMGALQKPAAAGPPTEVSAPQHGESPRNSV